MNAIETRGLCKRFKNRLAVDSLCLQVGQGELFALLGQNGAGKTTAIRMLCCLCPPSEGDALLLGDSIRSHPQAVKQKINISPQENAVAPKLSVQENLELVAQIYGKNRAAARAQAEELMAAFGLHERARERAQVLSGGMQRRLSLAMALISNPQILFLDEPTLGLDIRARRGLWQVLEQLKGQMTILLTTHALDEAEALADRIGIMSQGRLQVMGTVAEIKTAAGTTNLEEAFLQFTETAKEGVLL